MPIDVEGGVLQPRSVTVATFVARVSPERRNVVVTRTWPERDKCENVCEPQSHSVTQCEHLAALARVMYRATQG